MEAASTLWGWLAAGGGTLAFTFIIGLALGLASLTILFLGSAVVVLERFARVAKSPFWMIAFAATVSVALAAMGVHERLPELALRPWSEWLDAFWGYLASTVALTAAAVASCLVVLRFVSSTALARGALFWLGIVVVLYIGAMAQPPTALAPAAAIGFLAGGLALWRRRASPVPMVGEFEWQLRVLALLLVAAPLLALFLAAPDARVANVGSALGSLFFAFVVLGLLPLAAAGLVDMRRSVEWFIAVRYLFAKRREVLISAITLICVSGIAAGVWLIITVLSVMNGFERTWRDEIVGNRAHFTVHSGFGPFEDYESILEVVADTPGVIAVSPYLDAEGMIRTSGGGIFAVRVRGVDPERVGKVTDLRKDMIAGSLDSLAQSAGSNGHSSGVPPSGIVVGTQLASAIGAGVGDDILMISPYGGAPTPLGPAPRLARFRVVGIFQSSFFQYDEVYTYVALQAAQDFRRAGDVVDGLEARTTDFYRSRRVASEVIEELEYPFYSRDWKDYFPAFFQALKTERVMMFILLTMIMVVAAFVIVATLIMMIMEKSSDIAILKTMGAEDASIERIFAIEGTLIGLAGTVIGVLAGIAVTSQLGWIQDRIEEVTGIDTLPAEIYQFHNLPTEMDPVDVAVIATIAMILALGATLLPSRQGARVDPVEGLRHE